MNAKLFCLLTKKAMIMKENKKKCNYTEKYAIFSPCCRYRYLLARGWTDRKCSMKANMVAFIGLNPSIADGSKDDPTIRRCVNFAKSWGYDGMYMLNLFAMCATDPSKIMMTFSNDEEDVSTILGEENDTYLQEVTKESSLIIACWGNYGKKHYTRVLEVISNLQQTMVSSIYTGRNNNTNPNLLYCIKLNGVTGQPSHPLYLKKNVIPVPYIQL